MEKINLSSEKGSILISMVFSLMIIEFISLSLLTGVIVSTKANIHSQEVTIVSRIVESKMEEQISIVKEGNSCNPTYQSELYNDKNRKITVTRKQNVNENTCLIRLDYSFYVPNKTLTEEETKIESYVESLVMLDD